MRSQLYKPSNLSALKLDMAARIPEPFIPRISFVAFGKEWDFSFGTPYFLFYLSMTGIPMR